MYGPLGSLRCEGRCGHFTDGAGGHGKEIISSQEEKEKRGDLYSLVPEKRNDHAARMWIAVIL